MVVLLVTLHLLSDGVGLLASPLRDAGPVRRRHREQAASGFRPLTLPAA